MYRNEVQELIKTEPNAPNFGARLGSSTTDLGHFKLYLHNSGFDKAYTDKDHAIFDAGLTLTRNSDLFKDAIFLLAAAWGQEGHKMLDVAKYFDFDVNNWPGNPSVKNYVFRDCVRVQDPKQHTCGDASLVFAQEEMYRRSSACQSLDDFMDVFPVIKGLRFKEDE